MPGEFLLVANFPNEPHVTVNPANKPSLEEIQAGTSNQTQNTGTQASPAPGTTQNPAAPSSTSPTSQETRASVEATFSRVANGDASVVASTEYTNFEQASSQGKESASPISGATCQ